jgi:hypothetical protein
VCTATAPPPVDLAADIEPVELMVIDRDRLTALLTRFNRAAPLGPGRPHPVTNAPAPLRTAPAIEVAKPLELIADLVTMLEHTRQPLDRIAVCYLGDDEFADSLLLAGAALGMDVRIAAPRAQWPADAVLDQAEDLAADTDARLLVTSDAGHAVLGADYVIAGAWRAGAAPDATDSSPSPYLVTEDLVASTGCPYAALLVEGGEQAVTGFPVLRAAQLGNLARVLGTLHGIPHPRTG